MGDTREFHKHDGEISFIWLTPPPVPLMGFGTPFFPRQGQVYSLMAHHAESATYRLYAEDQLLATVSRQVLESGIDMRQFSEVIATQRGRQILDLIHRRNHIISDAWLNFVGHKRPGIAKGMPIPQAETEASLLDQQIRELSRPVELHLRLVAVSVSH